MEILQKILRNKKKILKYLISGGTAFSVDIFFLYLFTDIFSWHYLFSAIVAFCLAFFVSFFLQKFWTFEEKSKNGIKRQMFLHFILGLMNLGANTVGMYLLVDKLLIWYIFAQIILTAFISIYSFVIYHFIIFKKENNPLVHE